MKRIILGLSVLLMLVQNVVANESDDMDYVNSKKNQPALYQFMLCVNETTYHQNNGNVNICLKAVQYIKQGKDLGFLSDKREEELGQAYLKTAVLYQVSEKNYVKAYEYYMKTAKTNTDASKIAQQNLDILCNQHSWVCK